MEKRTHWKEIRNTHFVTEADITANDGDIFASICIDAWETDHDWEEGKVIAEVILSKHGDILVSYRNNLARVDDAAQAAIADAKEQLRKYWEEEKGYGHKHYHTAEQDEAIMRQYPALQVENRGVQAFMFVRDCLEVEAAAIEEKEPTATARIRCLRKAADEVIGFLFDSSEPVDEPVDRSPSYTVEQLLNSLFVAEGVFLRQLKPIPASKLGEYQGCYQFTRKRASRHSFRYLEACLRRLALTGVMCKEDAQEYTRRTQEKLVQEFAGICPPPEGKHYEFAGFGPDDILMLRIVDENI